MNNKCVSGKPGSGARAPRPLPGRAGTYRVALGAPAWIDLLADGEPLASTGHGHGPACTGVAKTVDFRLQPGRYVLQLSGASQAETTVMAARLP